MKIRILTLLIFAAPFALTTVASGQTADVGRALVASNALKLTADTERSGQVAPAKEFIVPYAGVVRIRWRLRSNGNGPATVSAMITSSIGACSSTTTATTFQLSTCDLRVVAGDRILVIAQGMLDPMTLQFSTVFIKGVRVYFNVVNATGAGVTLAD